MTRVIRPTIVDIAKRANVSTGAVSYALNGLPGVSNETRQRILTIAEEIGWRPSSAARSLSVSRAHAVGMILRDPPKRGESSRSSCVSWPVSRRNCPHRGQR